MIEQMIPHADFPPAGIPAPRSSELQWFADDRLSDYRKRGPHPLYGENDIVYRFNKYGYRCPEFDAAADLRMVTMGCSFAFGLGLPQEALFHERLAERLRRELSQTVVNWNLSIIGASNDLLARLLHLMVPRLDPHLILINFTIFARREYITATNQSFKFVPVWVPGSRVHQEVHGLFKALSSPFDNQLNFFRNYMSIQALLRDRNWLYSFAFAKHDIPEILAAHLDTTRRVDASPMVDKARDQSHPGPQSHELLYQNYWKKLVETGTLQRLQELTRRPG